MLGIFDSGVGGLTVVRALQARFPEAPFVYLGDTARAPYGNKSADLICQYAEEDVRFLLSQGATEIVIACHTASAFAFERLRQVFPDVPFFQVIDPAIAHVQREMLKSKKKQVTKVGVIGTRATIGSRVYQDRFGSSAEVIATACPLFVPLVEEGWMDRPETVRIARNYLTEIRRAQVDFLVLGCTHYPLLETVLRRCVQKRVKLISSADAVVEVLAEESATITSREQGVSQYYFTDPSTRTDAIASSWLKRPIQGQKADLFAE